MAPADAARADAAPPFDTPRPDGAPPVIAGLEGDESAREHRGRPDCCRVAGPVLPPPPLDGGEAAAQNDCHPGTSILGWRSIRLVILSATAPPPVHPAIPEPHGPLPKLRPRRPRHHPALSALRVELPVLPIAALEAAPGAPGAVHHREGLPALRPQDRAAALAALVPPRAHGRHAPLQLPPVQGVRMGRRRLPRAHRRSRARLLIASGSKGRMIPDRMLRGPSICHSDT